MQRNLIALGLAAGLTFLASSARTTEAGPCGAHPYFNDGGTLTWYTTLDEAVAAARASGRTLFVEFGRRECHNCKVVVQKILPCPEVRARLSATCVGLAADCDEPDPRVEALFKVGLPNANTLPFCGFATCDLGWITGFSGLVGADECMRQMDVVEASRARALAAARPCPSQATGAVPASVGVPVAPSAPTCPSRAALPAGAPSTAELVKGRDLLARARAAAAKAQYGEVLRLDKDAERMTLRVDPSAWRALVLQADGWAARTLDGAVAAGRERRYDDASKILASVEQEMVGCAGEREARTGAKALAKARLIEGWTPVELAKARATAQDEFRGTRWLELFKG